MYQGEFYRYANNFGIPESATLRAELNLPGFNRHEVDGGYGHTDHSRFTYFFFVRRLLLRIGTAEKFVDVRSLGSMGATLTVDLVLTVPALVNVVFVRMRMVPSRVVLAPFQSEAYPQRNDTKRRERGAEAPRDLARWVVDDSRQFRVGGVRSTLAAPAPWPPAPPLAAAPASVVPQGTGRR